MVSDFVIENIKLQLNSEKITFERIGWAWTNGAATSLIMAIDKQNLIDGILIFNFGIDLTGSGSQITINDQNIPNQGIIYRNANAAVASIVAPFIYFIKGFELNFRSTVATHYGFNYVTIRKDEDRK